MFGMGTGGTSLLSPPDMKVCTFKTKQSSDAMISQSYVFLDLWRQTHSRKLTARAYALTKVAVVRQNARHLFHKWL